MSRVGDMFKFGRSTRMYILGGPTELMPEEGLTKKQMLTMKALEVRGSYMLHPRHHLLQCSRQHSSSGLQRRP